MMKTSMMKTTIQKVNRLRDLSEFIYFKFNKNKSDSNVYVLTIMKNKENIEKFNGDDIVDSYHYAVSSLNYINVLLILILIIFVYVWIG